MGKVDTRRIIIIEKTDAPILMTPDGPVKIALQLTLFEEEVQVFDTSGNFIGLVEHHEIENHF